jgi:hypothetical protein
MLLKLQQTQDACSYLDGCVRCWDACRCRGPSKGLSQELQELHLCSYLGWQVLNLDGRLDHRRCMQWWFWQGCGDGTCADGRVQGVTTKTSLGGKAQDDCYACNDVGMTLYM